MQDDNDVNLNFDIFDENPPLSQSVDYTSFFATDKVFCTDDEAVEYVRSIGRIYRIQLVKIRLRKDNAGKVYMRYLACDRSRSWKGFPDDMKKLKSSKKCSCPFLLTVNFEEGVGWKVKVECGLHNHDIGLEIHACGFAGETSNYI